MASKVIFSCASGFPVEREEVSHGGKVARYFEKLEMTETAVDLRRLRAGASVLKCHQWDKPVGVVRKAWLEDGRLLAEVDFRENDPESQALFKDAEAGTLPNVSLGYFILQHKDRKGADGLERLVTRWMPFEISVGVGVPADPTVGFSREMQGPDNKEYRSITMNLKRDEGQKPEDENQEQQPDEGQKPEDENQEQQPGEGQKPEDENQEQQQGEGQKPEDENQEQQPGEGQKPEDQKPEENRQRNFTHKVIHTLNSGVHMTNRTRSYSLPNVIRSLCGATNIDIGYEREVSQEMQRQCGLRAGGRDLMIPGAAFRDFIGTGDSANGASMIGTDHLADEFLTMLRTRMGVKNARVLSGLTGNVEIPIQSGKVTVGWGAINSAASETSPTTSKLTLSPKKLTAYVDVAEDLINQGTPDAIGFVVADLQDELARVLDKTILKGNASVSISGIDGTSGVQSVQIASMSSATYANILAMTGKVADYEIAEQDLSWICKGSTRALLKGISKDSGSGRYLCEDNLMDGYPVDICGALTASDYDLYFGCWKNVIIGQWGGVMIGVDPYTGMTSGTTRLVVRSLCDIAIAHPESFVKRTASASSN